MWFRDLAVIFSRSKSSIEAPTLVVQYWLCRLIHDQKHSRYESHLHGVGGDVDDKKVEDDAITRMITLMITRGREETMIEAKTDIGLPFEEVLQAVLHTYSILLGVLSLNLKQHLTSGSFEIPILSS